MSHGGWETLLRRQDGVVSRRQALRFLSARVITRHIAAGRWQIVHRGVVVTHNGPVNPTQTLWAAALAAAAGGPALLAGLTALVLHGLQHFDSTGVHVLVPPGRQSRRPPSGVHVHRTTRMPASDIARTSPPSTTPARSMVDAASWARSDRQARAIIAMCFQQRLVTGAGVDAVLQRMPVVRRHALIAATVADAGGGAHSLGELDLVALCRREKLPLPSRQVHRDGRYLDAFFDEWGVWVEIDGAHHMSADQWWQDMDRHNALVRRGDVLLRFPAWLVRDRPHEVAERIRQALRDAGWK